jgi:hypothetical protein
MPHQAPLQPGDPRRVGRYRLAGRITGIPADGPIYLGTAPDGAEVMISMVLSDWTRDGAARDRFAAEAVVAKRVPPFCAARVLDAGLDAGSAYLVSVYVPGLSLLEVVSTQGVLAEADLDAVAIGMATGLASVHQAGLVHGNFGPEFVIMTAAGPRVVEFGITPPYGTATPSADMVAWAQTVVFAATGRPPTTMADLDVLPYYIRDLVADCLNPDPGERPAARVAVVELLGEHDPPAGVLAEGSRRAVPGGGVTRRLMPGPAGDRRIPASAGPHGRAGPAGATGPAAAVAAAGRPASAHPAGTRPASRPGRGAGAPARHPAGAELQPDRHVAHHQQAGRRRRTAPLIGGVAVVCVLVALGVIRLLGGTSTPRASTQGATSNPVGDRSAVTQPAAAKVPTPPAFAGRWSGHIRQPPNDIIAVTVRLTAGASTAAASYVPIGVSPCSETLTVTQATAHMLTLSQGAIQGQSCTAGIVVITLNGTGSMSFTFIASSGPRPTGTLTRS